MAFYFVTTTITTVGYGDISAQNSLERFFSIIMLFVGVMSFAFISGSLSSMITNNDTVTASLKQKLELLKTLRKQYKLDDDLVAALQSSIKFEYSKAVDGLGDFMSSLPLSLKHKLAAQIHKDVLVNFTFFEGKKKSFLPWMGHRLVPRLITNR